jgi:HD superfamily phosphohydrolase YqeK
MITYRDILNTDFFFNTYSQIEVMKRDFPVNHGFMHVWHVTKNCKKLAELFNITEEEKRLLMISAVLHDVGYIKGRENHAKNGAILAKEFLNDKMSKNEIEKICTAIGNHGGDCSEVFNDNISKCLILADKLDFDNTRYRYDEQHKESTLVYLSIEKVDFERNKEGFHFVIHTDDLSLFEGHEDRHFFKKLAMLFENFKIATGEDIKLVFNQTNTPKTNIEKEGCTF